MSADELPRAVEHRMADSVNEVGPRERWWSSRLGTLPERTVGPDVEFDTTCQGEKRMPNPDDLLAQLVDAIAPFMDPYYCSPYRTAWELCNYGDYAFADGEQIHEQVRQAWEAAKRHIEAQ